MRLCFYVLQDANMERGGETGNEILGNFQIYFSLQRMKERRVSKR